MTNAEINKIRKDIESLLDRHYLRDALEALLQTAVSSQMSDIVSEVEKLRQTYIYMLSYMTAGAPDPGRGDLLNDIYARAYRLSDMTVAALSEKEAPSFYYSRRRYLRSKNDISGIDCAITRWREKLGAVRSLSTLFAEASNASNENLKELEKEEQELFVLLWTSFPLKDADAKKITDLICDEATPLASAVRFVTALGLALTEFADSAIINALCDVYLKYSEEDDSRALKISSAAAMWLVIGLSKYGNRVWDAATERKLAMLGDMPAWNHAVRTVYTELIRSTDTERINRTMREDILPGMMSIGSEIEKKIREKDVIDPEEDFSDINPDWEKILSDRGIADKLKELNELQNEGADIYMSTFAHLKDFPFFSSIANWFTPMTSQAPAVEEEISRHPEIAHIVGMIVNLPYLCDSDKYSMLFSLEMLPDWQRNGMLGKMSDFTAEIAELTEQRIYGTKNDKSREELRNQLHNYYRFLKLYRRNNEFHDVFSSIADMTRSRFIKTSLEDETVLSVIFEFYFSRKYYKEALGVFSLLEEMGETDDILYQKAGYASEKSGEFSDAMQYYEKSELLGNTSAWLRQRLAHTYKVLGLNDKAIEKLEAILKQDPDNSKAALSLSYIYIDESRFREALKLLYRLEFEQNDDKELIRAIAWSLFMIRDFDRALQYYNKILTLGASAEDYLNMGHLAVGRNEFKAATNYYYLYIETGKTGVSEFKKKMEEEMPLLRQVGISDRTVSLIEDAVFYGKEIINP